MGLHDAWRKQIAIQHSRGQQLQSMWQRRLRRTLDVKCGAAWPTANRSRTRKKVEASIAQIPTNHTVERDFALALQWLVEEGPGSGMHRMGLYLQEGVEAVFEPLGIQQLDGDMIRTLRQRALVMTKIWIEGVLADKKMERSSRLTTPTLRK